MLAEPVPGLIVVFITVNVIVECPTTTRLSDQVTRLGILARPEAQHTALIAALVPFLGIDVAVIIERCCEFISTNGAPGREIMVTGQFQPDFIYRHSRLRSR